jgi:predicted acetyltransferase
MSRTTTSQVVSQGSPRVASSGRQAKSSIRSRKRPTGSNPKQKPADLHRESAAPKLKLMARASRGSRRKMPSKATRLMPNQSSTFRQEIKTTEKNVSFVRQARLHKTLPLLVRQNVFSEATAPGEAGFVLGRSGDHAAVYHTLLAIFQGPSREEFHAQAEDPFYEPTDRLLVKRGYRVLSHLQLSPRTMLFGQLALPVTVFQWLGTLPEFRGQGFAARLLEEADRRVIAAGATLGLLRTRVPRFFHRAGWALCGRHCFSQAKARDVLARLHVEHGVRQAKPLNIRLWRHVEMPALMRIYRQNAVNSYGPLERTEAYWRWLIGRKAYGSLLVALDGPDKLELEESIAPIVGYAVLRQERVLELLSAPHHPSANQQLLARACSDAIEHDRQDLILNAPPHHALHPLVVDASGVFHNQEANQNEVFMVKIIDPRKFFSLLMPELETRAKQAALPRGMELGLQVGGAKWRIVYTRHGMRIRTDKLGRNYLTLNQAEFTRLALGHGSVKTTAFSGRLQASTRKALDWAEILFPSLPLWRPVWDDLPA